MQVSPLSERYHVILLDRETRVGPNKSSQAGLIVRALHPLIHARRILPEIFLCRFSPLGGKEALHELNLLRDGGDTVAVRVIGSEDHTIFAEGIKEIFEPGAQ